MDIQRIYALHDIPRLHPADGQGDNVFPPFSAVDCHQAQIPHRDRNRQATSR